MAFNLSNASIQHGKIRISEHSFNYEFWRCQPLSAKLAAIWKMTVIAKTARPMNSGSIELLAASGGSQTSGKTGC